MTPAMKMRAHPSYPTSRPIESNPNAQRRYGGEWVATEFRWQFTAAPAKLDTSKVFAACPGEGSVERCSPVVACSPASVLGAAPSHARPFQQFSPPFDRERCSP
ncbi:hypothetical protein [Streptomyces sp. NPDC048428]|uniref:hypothetical protein n=1 Tax=Streptomyces sp. NPDC048428 TaxID=3154503 RepID=UPI003449480E